MNALEFKNQWAISYEEIENLKQFLPEEVDVLEIPEGQKEFLTISGLPYYAPMELSFGDETNTRLHKLLDIIEEETEHSLEHYYVIGSNGFGDPVCIHAQTGMITEHNQDAGYEPSPVNSSLAQLAACLLFIREVNRQEEKYEGLREALRKIDPAIIGNHSFWTTNLDL